MSAARLDHLPELILGGRRELKFLDDLLTPQVLVNDLDDERAFIEASK